jgi:hypothetical protein
LLLKKFQKQYAEHRMPIRLDTALPELRKIFWEEIIDEATELIVFHIVAAEKYKQRSLVFGTTDFMEQELHTLHTSAQKTLEERKKALEFIMHYGRNPTHSPNPQKPLSYN